MPPLYDYSSCDPRTKVMHEWISERAENTRKDLRALGIRRTPSGIPKPTDEQRAEEKRLKDQWWTDCAPYFAEMNRIRATTWPCERTTCASCAARRAYYSRTRTPAPDKID